MPSHKSSPKFVRKESNEETKAPLKLDTSKNFAPKLDHSDSFVGPTDGDHDNAVMISEMDSPGLNPLPTSAMSSLLKQIEKEEEDVGFSKKATLGLPKL